MIKNNVFTKINVMLVLILAYSFNSCKHNSEPEEEKFEKEMVKALNLKLISHSLDYRYSRIEIIHDTITGFYHNRINGKSVEHFFIKSINNPRKVIKFHSDKLRYSSVSHVDDYRNGCLFFGAYGLGFMQSLCPDGTLTDYFMHYNDTLFYATKVMLYKNKAVLTSMNGLYIFDIDTQRLLWKYNFGNSPMEGLSVIIGDRLIFTESKKKDGKGFTYVGCLNLNELRTKWESVIPYDADYLYDQKYVAHYTLYQDGNNVIIPQINACYALDLDNGFLKERVPWKGFFTLFNHDPRFNVENHILYVNNYNDQTTLLCIDMRTNQVKWKMKNVYYHGLYKKYVVACTSDLKFYLIIDKLYGKVKHKIFKPKSNQMDFDFIDKYILINQETIYK